MQILPLSNPVLQFLLFLLVLGALLGQCRHCLQPQRQPATSHTEANNMVSNAQVQVNAAHYIDPSAALLE